MVRHLIRLIRVQQWTKNFFVFIPAFFAGKFLDVSSLSANIAAFFVFSLTASGLYILNDYFDMESDKNHPVKAKRPLASGAVKPYQAFVLFAGLLVIAVLLALLFLNAETALIVCAYLVLNILYSFKLKHFALVDIFIIAVGFVLRLFAGSFASSVYLSHWIILMTFLLALFIAFAKRRDDVALFNKTGEKMRASIDGYNLAFVNAAMPMMGAIVIVSYIMYSVDAEVVSKFDSPYLYLTVVWVLLGVLRYLQLALVEERTGSPTRLLLSDFVLQFTILAWVANFALLIYF